MPTEGVRIIQRMHGDKISGIIRKIDLEIQVPDTFPKNYLPALIRSAELCTVKKHLEQPPQFEVTTQVLEAVV